ncbi:MAG: V-type ATP synthase subunit E [Bacillota bacterium]|jgi:V/A-type H+-transporting ATPase subunit E
MQNLDRLVVRIIDEARGRADDILKDADARCAALADESRKKADDTYRIATDRATQAAALEERRAQISRSLDVRNAVLRAKGDMVDALISEIPARIQALPDQEYLALMKKMMIDAAPDGQVEVVVAEPDRERIDAAFVAEVQSELASRGRDSKLRLAGDTLKLTGGFIMRASALEIDCSLDAILAAGQDELAPLVAEALLGR